MKMSQHRLLTGKVVIATHNQGKLREMRELLAPYGIELVSAGDLGLPEPVEDGTMFSENAAIKAVADAPELGLPAEDCSDVDARMTDALTEIATKAVNKNDKTVFVVSSGLSISCFAGAPDMRDTTGAAPTMPPAGVPNLGVTKVIYKNGSFTIDGPVGSKAYYPQP